jgi:ATP-dependent Clp protease ATP-binding subunit ClpC
LKRAIQKYLEDEMAEAIIGNDISEDDTITIDLDETKEKITVSIIPKVVLSIAEEKSGE